MTNVSVFVKLTAQDGKRDELVAAFQDYFPQVESEDGTLAYAIATDNGDENVLWVYETYTDEAALGAHGGSDAFAAFGAKLGGILGAPPEMSMATPVVGKGVPG